MRRLDDSSDADDAAFQQALRALPSVEEQAQAEAKRLFDAHVASRHVDEQSVYATCEDVTDEVVDKFNLAVGGEDNAIAVWNKVYADLLEYVSTRYPTTGPDDAE